MPRAAHSQSKGLRGGSRLVDVREIAVVALGAGIGGVLRLLVTQFVVGRFGAGASFYATLFINVGGSFLIGIVIETFQLRANVSPLWRFFLATGVLGGYTTFSTFSYEALYLFTNAMTATAIFYVVASVLLGVTGSLLGIATARSLAH